MDGWMINRDDSPYKKQLKITNPGMGGSTPSTACTLQYKENQLQTPGPHLWEGTFTSRETELQVFLSSFLPAPTLPPLSVSLYLSKVNK